MNLSKKILILIGVLLLTSCTATPNVEPANEEQSLIIDRLTDNYTIEEIQLPEELIPNEWMYMTSLEQIDGYQFETNILNKSISHIYPIEKGL